MTSIPKEVGYLFRARHLLHTILTLARGPIFIYSRHCFHLTKYLSTKNKADQEEIKTQFQIISYHMLTNRNRQQNDKWREMKRNNAKISKKNRVDSQMTALSLLLFVSTRLTTNNRRFIEQINIIITFLKMHKHHLGHCGTGSRKQAEGQTN